MELLAAAALGILALRAPSGWVLVAWCWAGLLAIALGLIDAAVLRLPDILTASAGLGVLLLLAVAAVADGQPTAFLRSVLGGVGLTLLYLIPILSARMNMGRGDGQLAFLIGACLGWIGIDAIGTATLAAALIALIYIGAVLAPGRLRRGDPVPVGTIMLVGAVAALPAT